MSGALERIASALEAGADRDEVAALPLPTTYRGLVVRRDEIDALAGVPVADRDPGATLHVDEVDVPELAPDEALVAVMASAINFNTVWSAVGAPVPTFRFLERNGRRSAHWRRHDRPYHVLGSDAAGVVLRTGAGVSSWRAGDRVVVHGAHVDLEAPAAHGDAMLDPHACAWGYETNFGGLAELAVAKATQLLPKPEHLTWEEAACNGVANSTVYRQLVSDNGAAMKQGDVVLVWGASGGIGSYAIQYALNGGAHPVAVVSSPERAEAVRRAGCEWVIDRRAEGYRFLDGDRLDAGELRRFRDRVRGLTGGQDPDVVFEHTGRETFGASVHVAARGGVVVTCASTTGYEHVYDNRHLWTGLKRIVGTHIANLREAALANRLVARGAIHPALWRTVALDAAHAGVRVVARNEHAGKVGVLCLAAREGLGVRDPELRARHAEAIALWRGVAGGEIEIESDNGGRPARASRDADREMDRARA